MGRQKPFISSFVRKKQNPKYQVVKFSFTYIIKNLKSLRILTLWKDIESGFDGLDLYLEFDVTGTENDP